MRATISILLLVFRMSAQTAAPPPPATETPTFRTDVALVRVDVQVAEGGQLITGLRKEDFVLLDEGQPQPIAYFGRQADPLDLLLLVDVSGSMRPHIEQMAAVAGQALRILGPDDRVAVMLFGRQAELRQDLTESKGRVVDAIREAAHAQKLGSGTQINPALVAAARELAQQKPRDVRGRRAVLILTDNQAMHYQSPDATAIKALSDADAVLDAIVVGKGSRPAPPKAGQYVNPDFTPADVFRIAEATGGEGVKADQVGKVFPVLLERIRTRYSLQYRPPQGAMPGTFRRVQVTLSSAAQRQHSRARVLARDGYYVP